MTKEVTRNYRYDSMADSGEFYLYVGGQDSWSEDEWNLEAETRLADTVQRPQYWIISDYEEWGE